MEAGRESRDKRHDVEVEVKIVKPLFDHTIGKRCSTHTLQSKYKDIIDCRKASIFLCRSLQRFPRYPSTFIASFGQILRKYMITRYASIRSWFIKISSGWCHVCRQKILLNYTTAFLSGIPHWTLFWRDYEWWSLVRHQYSFHPD